MLSFAACDAREILLSDRPDAASDSLELRLTSPSDDFDTKLNCDLLDTGSDASADRTLVADSSGIDEKLTLDLADTTSDVLDERLSPLTCDCDTKRGDNLLDCASDLPEERLAASSDDDWDEKLEPDSLECASTEIEALIELWIVDGLAAAD